ncbi:ABC transporter transmembrane domain-containing protein [Jiangella anatolica]|uniref:Multidrug ABC transporter permease n=1 Tax=Jiangella anatolica TaxID=2670374 RepID=A0A2W2B8G7_9ACTN|nr:ABC transporter ATP-binding protein [Jiangella anatolica]PZF83545.1 multidrug ABC transporter permease [Jiangella anatolica]
MRRFPEPDPGVPSRLTPGRYLLWLARVQFGVVLLGAFYGCLWPTAQALIPYAVGRAIDDGLTGRDRGDLLLWGGVVLALGVAQAAAGILQDRCALTNALGARYRTLQLVTRQAARLGATLPRKTSAGEVLSVGVADVTAIGRALDLSSRTIGAVASIVVVAAIMLATSWRLGLVVLAGVPLIVWATALLLRPLHDRQTRLRVQQAELTAQAVDIVGGLRVLRGIGGESLFGRRYDDESQRVRHAGVHVARAEAALEVARMLLPGLLVAAIVFLGARQVLSGELTGGQLVAFYGFAVFLATPVRRIVVGAGAIMKALVAARRVVTLLALSPSIGPGGGSAALAGGVLVDPVSGLLVEEGRFTAVVCAAPGDAAALADRLGRYVESSVTYGGLPLASVDVDEVRRRILVSGNDARLFAGLLRTELCVDREADDAELLAAVDVASAADVLEALPDGLDTVVASGGKEFSGGQLQRLRLARAVLTSPDVLVLVEPTSAVDAHTEARIAARLAAARAGRTTVVFATSPILLDHADSVVLVDAGAVVATGTHASLLADPRYRALVAREEGPA